MLWKSPRREFPPCERENIPDMIGIFSPHSPFDEKTLSALICAYAR